jgi:hypothetical protein
LNRRNFFKVVAAVAGAAALPAAATALVDAASTVLAGSEQVGLIREVMAYDISWDFTLFRYDILAKERGLQIGVDFRMWSDDARDAEKLEAQRAIALRTLEKEMARRGVKWSDLRPLPIPSYVHGRQI